MNEQLKPIRVIGIGNTDRGDDGLGLQVVNELYDRLPEHVSAVENSGEVSTLMDCLEEGEVVYLVDAATMGLPPGTLRVFDVSHKPLPALGGYYSTHAMGLKEAVELARALQVLPPVCRVFAVEAVDFEHGHGLSDAVAAAVPRVVNAVLKAIEEENTHA